MPGLRRPGPKRGSHWGTFFFCAGVYFDAKAPNQKTVIRCDIAERVSGLLSPWDGLMQSIFWSPTTPNLPETR